MGEDSDRPPCPPPRPSLVARTLQAAHTPAGELLSLCTPSHTSGNDNEGNGSLGQSTASSRRGRGWTTSGSVHTRLAPHGRSPHQPGSAWWSPSTCPHPPSPPPSRGSTFHPPPSGGVSGAQGSRQKPLHKQGRQHPQLHRRDRAPVSLPPCRASFPFLSDSVCCSYSAVTLYDLQPPHL